MLVLFFVFYLLFLKLSFLGFSQIEALESSKKVESFLLDSFEKEGDWKIRFSKYRSKFWDSNYHMKNMDKNFYSKNENWIKWIKSNSSNKFFSKINLIPPTVLNRNSNNKGDTILSIRGEWDKKGYNWLIIYPSSQRYGDIFYKNSKAFIKDKYINDSSNDGQNFIIFPGEVESLSVFVWSIGYPYKIEAHFFDYTQAYHSILGDKDLGHFGWQEINFNIPKNISQKSKYFPYSIPLKFLGFKIFTKNKDPYKGFFAYLDHIKVKKVIQVGSHSSSLVREDIFWPKGNKKEDSKEAIKETNNTN